MKTIGYADSKWSLREAIKKQIEVEDNIAWSKRKLVEVTQDYTPHKFELSDSAKHVFTKGIYYVKLLRL